jgi:hypothetical protein
MLKEYLRLVHGAKKRTINTDLEKIGKRIGKRKKKNEKRNKKKTENICEN